MNRPRDPHLVIAELQRTPLRMIGRELMIGVPICVGVALLLTAVFEDRFTTNLVFSLCIGLTIQALIELGRFGMAQYLRRRGGAELALQANWPGWRQMAPWTVLSVLAGYAIGSTLATALTGKQHLVQLLSGSLRPLAVISVVVFAVSLGTTYFFYLRGRMLSFEALAEAARRSAAETQLKLLQSQLEPHMLFNTLANLRVLIGMDPQQAQAMLDRLIAFLRATLNASRAQRHPLAAEFERIDDYLSLMAVRMGPRLRVRLDLPEPLRTLPVPPLLLQPLVENSIQHGLEPKVEGGEIDVSARRDGSVLRLTVRDSGVGLAEGGRSAGTGFGTAQVRERLAALYGPRARFELRADGAGGTLAAVELPIEDAATP